MPDAIPTSNDSALMLLLCPFARQHHRPGRALLCRTFYAEYRGTFQCPEWLGALYFPCRQYMTRALTASLPPGKVADLAEDAVARLFLKQGQKWEPQRAEPGASTQSGKEGVSQAQAIGGAAAGTMLQAAGIQFEKLQAPFPSHITRRWSG